ncbi:WhiB family transcriptional regulator, redox-sensing transcriptional regulator [Actinacidiphila alni]|uniref:Transcriptional regulator WhiB n=1 Tax=Actinacidiphila alni TaxID=380248 RepID=A0A1I2LGZ8_9ACTN|nr:WhiB family transcriptional regulator [Actinacidiphila alni]SFF76737.1 WhiB family transcriptional regulator, redox-sensing transcriptional regulator [Actinacidiphila alni]
MDWKLDAACQGEDPERFFPVGHSGSALLQEQQAKDVCRRCPVVEQCLAWAMDTRQEFGVWGGRNEDERRSMRRRAARQTRTDTSRS